MKKLYTIAMAAAVTLTAAANTRQQAVPFAQPAKAVVEMPALPGTSLPANAPVAKVVGFKSVAEVAGDYDWNYYGLLTGSTGNQTGAVTLKVLDEAAGTVQIDGLFAAGTGITGTVKGTVDLQAGTLTIANKQNLGKDSAGDTNYFYFKSLDSEGKLVSGAYAGADVVAQIEGKSFKFPEDIVFAVGDFNAENLGWWALTALNSFDEYVEPNDGVDLAEWTEFTTATMIDGWIMPVIQDNTGAFVDPAKYPLNVKVAKKKDNPNLLLIENPYVYTISGFPMADGETGYIVLDITDPEFVLVMPGVFSGFKNGANRLYCLNVESFYVGLGYNKATIQEALKDEVSTWSTLTTVDGKSVIDIPNCRFNYQSAQDKLYAWNGREAVMKAKFTFADSVTGVQEITVSDANAPVEYFNLQGVRVNEPAAGTLVIRRQGSNVTKVLVK